MKTAIIIILLVLAIGYVGNSDLETKQLECQAGLTQCNF